MALNSADLPLFFLFFFNDTAPTEFYTLSLHDALPIWRHAVPRRDRRHADGGADPPLSACRSEEHTSELQSRSDLVCRLLLEKKKKNKYHIIKLIYMKKKLLTK